MRWASRPECVGWVELLRNPSPHRKSLVGFAKSSTHPTTLQRLQPLRDLAGSDIGLLQQFAHGEEAVELPGKMPVGDGNAGLLQPLGVFTAFVAQWIGA